MKNILKTTMFGLGLAVSASMYGTPPRLAKKGK